MISLRTAREDADLIAEIVEKAMSFWNTADPQYGLLVTVALTAVHANAGPLRLKEMLAADDLDLAADLLDIRWFFSRQTGKLDDNFRPWFAA